MKGKRKYTKEQLEFYFKKLMNEIGRVPTIEDVESHAWMPSSHVYVERFGSWKKAKDSFGNLELNRTRCTFCGKEVSFKKITKRFCSKRCYNNYRHARALEKVPLKRCVICKKEFSVKSLKDRKRKVCYNKDCVEKHALISYLKKKQAKEITPYIFSRIADILGNRCIACRFSILLKLYPAAGRENDLSIINRIRRNEFSIVLVCPNHYEMLKKGFAELKQTGRGVEYAVKENAGSMQ